MPNIFIFVALSALFILTPAHANISEKALNRHKQSFSELIASQCENKAPDTNEVNFKKVATALAQAEEMDNEIDLEPGLLNQMHKLLPRYIDCDTQEQGLLEPIMDSFIAFLAVNRHLSAEERRAYVQFAMKLAEIEKENVESVK
ncbi:hypothetical protein G5S52_03620 [Grimontia sp. S25]|uniref:Secreted protein n=1 Tax=Grimontia sedimenti TaxID=2711294 RepID=A0A6M1R3E6_9GAMM|nr:hypothetical protein [Grimontia sedimenti]NGN96773.1 hypothetical protein [Grimontia sedimenti]